MSIFCTSSVPSCVTPSQKKPLQRLQPVYIKSKKKDTRKFKKKIPKKERTHPYEWNG